MNERTIRIVQSCTADEAAAMVAAIRAFEERTPIAARTTPAAAGNAGPRPPSGAGRASRRDGAAILWTRPATSPGRGS